MEQAVLFLGPIYIEGRERHVSFGPFRKKMHRPQPTRALFAERPARSMQYLHNSEHYCAKNGVFRNKELIFLCNQKFQNLNAPMVVFDWGNWLPLTHICLWEGTPHMRLPHPGHTLEEESYAHGKYGIEHLGEMISP